MIIIGTPHTKSAGYYRNDDTASGGKVTEADIQTCKHCQAVIKMQEWKMGTSPFCIQCASPVCEPCAKRMEKHGCEPFKKKIEEALERHHRRLQLVRAGT